MWKRNLYYQLKPYVPWRMRNLLRRAVLRKRLAQVQHIWPINPACATRPTSWLGWPEGKSFSVILTHDVEGPEGVAKCDRLAALEEKYGFVSSFNFIPEGTYRVAADQRERLAARGFEIGVHDLNHDGKLYRSREEFARKATVINRYLKEWGAAGFRAGFMFHNLEWLHDLDVEYDASTFDVDPFEPQPDGVDTIFPFRVASSDPRRPGYIELPYTLPQDSTMFLLLREKTSRIWIEKCDWVASHGGMVLVNVHPDYIQFPGDRASPSTFPAERYEDLLRHISANYAGNYWHALPRDVARFMRSGPTDTAPSNALTTLKS